MGRYLLKKEAIALQTDKFSLANEDGSYEINIFTGEGLPVGTDADAAAAGSMWIDTTDSTAGLYIKESDGGAGTWNRIFDYFTLTADGGTPVKLGGGGTFELSGDAEEIQTTVSDGKIVVNNVGPWKGTVIDKDLSAPPGGENDGDRYIVAAGASGDWAGHSDDIATYNTNLAAPYWQFTTPTEGVCVYVNDEDILYVYDGASWGFLAVSVAASDVTMARIAGSTYYTVQHMQDIFHSAGCSSGGGITDNLDGTVDVAAGTGFIRATDSSVAQILFFDWALSSSLALTDLNNNWVYVDYNGGSPQVVASTTKPTNFHQYVILGTVYRDGTDLHVNTTWKHQVGDHASLMIQRMQEANPYARVSGGIIGETGTRNITITAGEWWHGLTNYTTAAFDSSAADTFDYYYLDGIGGWTEVTGQTQIDNLYWDDTTGTLNTLTAGRYGVHWVYIGTDGDVDILYGYGDYTLPQAQAATAPSSLPGELVEHARLIGKIIIQQGASTFTEILSVFDTQIDTSVPTDHGSLTGLDDPTDHTWAFDTTANTETIGDGSAAEYTLTVDLNTGGGGSDPVIVYKTREITYSHPLTMVSIAADEVSPSAQINDSGSIFGGTDRRFWWLSNGQGLVPISDFTVIGLQDAPPGSPLTGDTYIVGTSGSGDWAGHSNDIATWVGTVWDFWSATYGVDREGIRLWVKDEDRVYAYDGTSWFALGATATSIYGFGLALASTSSTGVASFNSSDFLVSGNGEVTYVDTTVRDVRTDSGPLTPVSHRVDFLGGEGIDVTHSGITVTIAGEAASTTNSGISELATSAEVDTGTDTARTITPDALAASYAGTKSVGMVGWGTTTSVATITLGTDDAPLFVVPASMNGMKLVAVYAAHYAASSGATGSTTMNVYKNGTAMLSSTLDIAAQSLTSSGDSYTIKSDTTEDIATYDRITIGVSDVTSGGTQAKGLTITMEFRLP